MWTLAERRTLLGLGAAAALGLALIAWQQQRPPMRVVAGAEPSYAAWDAALDAAARIDLNAATAEELERLPSIGPSLAARIVAHRAARGGFSTVNQVREVPGIGPVIFERVRDRLTVDGPVAAPAQPGVGPAAARSGGE